MIIYIFIAIILGAALGKYGVSAEYIESIDLMNQYVLWALLFIVGVDLGKNQETIRKIKKMGIRVILVPVFVALGSLAGALICKAFLNIELGHILAISAGFGWYSLSAVLLKDLVNPEIGAIAFLANVFREVFAIILIPVVAKFLGKLPAVGPGGATSMDTTLPFVNKYAGSDVAVIGFISGVFLTIISPILIPLLINL